MTTEVIQFGPLSAVDGSTDEPPLWPEDDPPPDFNDYLPNVYRFYVFDIIRDEILAELNMTGVTFTNKLGQVGDFSGTVRSILAQTDIDLYWATMPMKTAIYVTRNNRAVWGGVIWSRSYSAKDMSVQINAGTWESYLARRFIWHTKKYPNTVNQYYVVRRLLLAMRNDFVHSYYASDNVTPVPAASKVDTYTNRKLDQTTKHQDAQTFDRSELKSFYDTITEFANNLNGFEWWFQYIYNNQAQRFRRRLRFIDTPPGLLPKGSANPPYDEDHRPGIDTYLFEWPGNIIDVTLDEDTDQACTRQFVVGGFTTSLDTTFKPIGSWNNKKYLDAGFPMVENVESSRWPNVSKITRLNNLARIIGTEASPPIKRWQVTVNGSMDPIIGTYHVGHWCRIVIHDAFIQASLQGLKTKDVTRGVVKRIVGFTVTVPDGPQLPESVTLELEDDVVVS